MLERKHWVDGPPHALFEQMREGCPVHWTSEVTELPEAAGFWSVTTADDVHAVSRDWETYSSELGGVVAIDEVFPIELARAMFIGMDPPKHDRLKALFQAGFTPKRIAAHEESIRRIVVDVLDRLEGRESCDLVTDVAQPAVSRVIGSFMGIPEEDDAAWAELMNKALAASDPDYSPDGPDSIEAVIQKAVTEIFARCSTMIAERRENPTDDLTTVLVDAEVEGEKARGARDRDGLLPPRRRRQRQHQGDLLQRDAGASGRPRPAPARPRRPGSDPQRGRGVAANVPRLRPLPPHRDQGHRSRTARRSSRARR